MSNRIAFDPKRECFFVKGSQSKLSGLHRVLQAKFYPVMSTYSNIRRFRYAKRKNAKIAMTHRNGKPLPKVGNLRQALSRGKLIDSQMQRLVEAAQGDPLVLRSWVHATGPVLGLSKEQKQIKKPKMKMHPFTAAGINKVLDADWVPVACQQVVGSVQHRIATMTDLTCRHRTKKNTWAVFEVKSGYDKIWQADTGQYLNKPLGKLRDSPQNKAHLQVACTALLYKVSTGYQPQAFVLNINASAGAQLEPLKAEIATQMNEVARVLCAPNQSR